MKIILIVAVAKNRVIGRGGKIPWHISEDLKLFKKWTFGHHILMGRKTFESLPGVLPGRTHLVVSRKTVLPSKGNVQYFGSISSAVEYAREKGEDKLFICGGAQIYKEFLESADEFYISHIQEKFDGDVFFPEYDFSRLKENERWRMREKEPYWDFVVYERTRA